MAKTFIELDREFVDIPAEVTLTGNTLTIPEIVAVARKKASVAFSPDPHFLQKIEKSYSNMMEQVKQGIPIYGCNTGYGGRASHIVTNGTPEERIDIARKISEGITHIDVSVGPLFAREVVRAGMLIRINMLLQGVSAVKIDNLEIYRNMLNAGVTPLVNQYGGIGASGDLAHNSRVLSAARHLEGTKVYDVDGTIGDAGTILSKHGIPPLVLEPKAGLGLVNGDNFSTGLAALLAVDTLQLLIISNVLGAIAIEALKGSDRSFHPLLSAVRPHTGQKEISQLYRYLLDGSGYAYQEMSGHQIRPKGVKVQDGYSLRCISQFHAINIERIKSSFETIKTNANSVSDNPLWVSEEYATSGEEAWQWVSGGNFLAMHMSEIMDGLRKTMTHIVKLNDRHLARLVAPRENNGLPANLSDKKAITQCAFKGTQIQSGMLEVYSTLLSIPVSTFFGVHEESNQDITSHALTSGILGIENLRLARYSTAQNLLAVAQAIDLRGGPERLSTKTKPVYEFIREKVSYVTIEKPLNNEIETLYQSICNDELIQIIRDKVLNDYPKQ